MKEKDEVIIPKVLHDEIEPEPELREVIGIEKAEELQKSGWTVVSAKVLGIDRDTQSQVKKYLMRKLPPKEIFT